MKTLVPGIDVGVTAPMTYTMHYLNGPITYTEPVCLLHISSTIVAGVQLAIDLTMDYAMKAVTPLGPVAVAVGGLVRVGWHWYGKAQLETDGSLLVRVAPHHVGANLHGVDVTAFPIPGVDPRWWGGIVQGLAGAAGRAVTDLELTPMTGDDQPANPDRVAQAAWAEAHRDVLADPDATLERLEADAR